MRGRDPETGAGVSVTVVGDRIATVSSCVAAEGDPWLAPGLVDLQLNGFSGIDLNDGRCDIARIIGLCRAVARTGTASFLATLITASQQSLVGATRVVRAACEVDPFVEHLIGGLHLEGPFLSPLDGYRGAHPAAWVRPPSLQQFLEIHEASGGRIRLVTVSPHWEEAPGFIRAVTLLGVVCSIGHTHATASQITAAVDAGACMSTHLGNGLPLMLPRHTNPMWPQMVDDRLIAGLIADGIHLPPNVLKAMARAKGAERSVLISDAVALAGMPRGSYPAAIGSDVVVGEDGSVRMRDTGLLAGSGISLATAVARFASMTGRGLAEALRMATTVPAHLLGVDRGELKPGGPADLILFKYHPGETSLTLTQVIVMGQVIDT